MPCFLLFPATAVQKMFFFKAYLTEGMSRDTSNKLVRRLDSCLADKLSVGESNKVRDLLPVQKLAQLMLWNGNVD